MPHNSIRTAICDPLSSVGEMLSRILDERPEFAVRSTSTHSEAIREALLPENEVDLLVSEIRFPESDIFIQHSASTENSSRMKWVIFTSEVGPLLIQRLNELPISGIVLKSEPLERVIQGLLTVITSENYFSPTLRPLVEGIQSPSKTRIDQQHPAHTLTEHQLDILKRLACGYSVKEIAAQMHLSPKSIDSHKYRIMQKLGIHDRVHLTRFAIRENLIDP